ncbi:MAG: phosphatase PAP2 family protein [Clostridia bacterium]|nr:phosphatase PAP2 family protein [Clostridia bacterium]
MTVQNYQKWTQPLRKHPGWVRILLLCNTVLTRLIYVSYPILLLFLCFEKNEAFLRVLLTPAISFVLLSIFRDWINAPRPYEKLDIQPLIHKNTKGHSFPSRHVFSVAVIACAFLYTIPWIGVIFLVLSILMAVIRVLGGVHFPKDVIAGLVIGLISGMIGFILL